MCVPLIPLALMAAGTLAKFIGAKQAERARNNTFNAERDRQNAFTEDQQGRFQDSLDKTKGMLDPAAVAAAANAREGTLAGAIAPSEASASYLPGSSSAPSIVADAKSQAEDSSRATSMNLARTLATLGGTTDQLQNLDIGIGRNSQSIGQIGSFKAGSMGVLDSEMRAAAQKGAFLRGVGGLAQQIGSAWMGASGGGIGGAGGATKGIDVTRFSGMV